MNYDLIVIGGGPAGVTAALRARELGATVALVEQTRLGGNCTNDGCAPTRVLAKAARLMREAEHFDEYGLVGHPPVPDMNQLLARVRETIDRLHDKKRLEDVLEGAGVSLYLGVGHAQFANEHAIVLADGSRLEAAKFVLCAGGHARRISFPGSEYALTHSDIWSLETLPRSMAIVGGSATGCQLASIFDALGTEVWLMERNEHIVKQEDQLVSEVVAQSFQRRGIHIVLGSEAVQRIDKDEDGLHLTYLKEGQPQSLTVDVVVMAIGWPGNADALNLEAANVASERGYVAVDEYLRTSAPHIFAAGDINGQMMLVQSASNEARIAAENAVLGVGQPHAHHIVPHGNFTDPEYASVGLTEEQAGEVEGGYVVSVVPYADLDRAVIDDRTTGFCKLIASRETHRILGAHIVGEQALEVIQLVAAGMAADMWVEQLAELELAYPTYTAIVGLAARHLVRQLGVMPLAAEWHALGTPHVAEWERSGEWSQPG
jgi:pyruvate/2-oxoglutarate dehydrogenase complex dihydrolipoamide dehydrogenase (E3) component